MSSACCSVRESRQSDPVACPRCGEKGKAVSLATVGAMAKTEVEASKLSAREYKVCRNRDCPIVYYAGRIELVKSDLRVPVNFIECEYEGPVCYCFNPDSAVAIDRKREAQSFRSEVDGLLPLSRHRSAVLRGGCLSLIATTCESAKPLSNFTVGRLCCSRIPPRFRHF